MFGWLTRLKIVHKLALGFSLILLLMGTMMDVNVSVSVHHPTAVGSWFAMQSQSQAWR